MLYITEFIAGDRHVGCTASSILRYYFIMTSLMWNGVEGVNMYILLVKVMNSHVHRFVLKAAVVAWGKLRMVHSYCKYTTQLKMLTGIYYVVKEHECQLKPDVIHV